MTWIKEKLVISEDFKEAIDMAIEALEAQQEFVDATNEIYAKGYNAAKREIALSGEYERAYHRGKVDATKWIPVSERLPSNTGEYLVTAVCDNEATFTDKFGYTPTTDGGWYDPEAPSQTYTDWNQHIIAWKPLPKPYKGGDSE